MINCFLLVLLMLVSRILLKCTNSTLGIHFLNFDRLFHLQILLIINLFVSFVIFFHLYFLMITLAKILFLLFLKLKMQIIQENVLFPVTSLFTNILLKQTIDIAINLIFTKKELKKLSFLVHHRSILFLTVIFLIKTIEQPWILLWILSLPIFPWVFKNRSS